MSHEKLGGVHDGEKSTVPLDSASAGNWLRSTWAGQLYFKHLKRHFIFQLLASWVWRKSYFLYRLMWVYNKSLQRQIIPLSSYLNAEKRQIFRSIETVESLTPMVFPEILGDRLRATTSGYQFPEIFRTHLSNALVTGGTNLIMVDDAVICHDLYDFARDYTSEELNLRVYIWPRRNRIAWMTSITPSRHLSHAACFTDACAANYAHWMTEVLPRINLFYADKDTTEIPLIVNAGLHQNILKSLQAVVGQRQEVVCVEIGESVAVEHLHVTSVTGYVPFERRTNNLKNHSHGVFSPYALSSLRDRLKKNVTDAKCQALKKIFIRRNSGIRNLINGPELENVLLAQGYSVVEPEKLSFAEQVFIFSNADVVVGATGAAFANLIFCRPDTKITILISDYKHMPYWYWQNMANAVGNRVTYVLGKCVNKPAHLHSNFKIDPVDLLDAIA